MKKVLSFVLVLSLVLGSFSMAFAADSKAGSITDIAGNANEDAIQVAYDLGIVTGNPDGTFLPEKAVTRAEFAAMLTRALAIPDSALAGYTSTSFKDTVGYSWAVPYLAFCQSKGILLGDGAGNVMPGKTITVNEAMTMALRAIGYTANSALLVGAWPANYVSIAQNEDMYTDVAANTTVNKASAAQIIYNLLTVQKVAVNTDGETIFQTIKVKKEEIAANLLNTNLGCTEKDDVVIGDDYTYETSIINITGMIGSFGTAYENDDKDLVAFIPDSTALTGKVDGDKFKVGDVKYDFDGDGAKFTDAAVTFANTDKIDDGVTLKKADIADFADDNADDNKTVTLYVDLSGKKIKDVYSAVVWATTYDESDAALASEDVQDDIEDHQLLGADFAEDDDDNIDFKSFKLVGATALADIAKDDVLYVYADKDENIRKIAVGTETVEGIVEELDEEDNVVTIDAKDYDIAAVATTEANDLDVDDEGIFYLDYEGKVFDFDGTGGVNTFAVVKAASKGDNFNNVKAKLYISEDSTGTYYFNDDADKITWTLPDGETKTSLNIDKTSVGAVLAPGALVGYKLDKDGEIDALDVTAFTGTTAEFQSTKVLNVTAGTTTGSFSIASDAVVFTYDGTMGGGTYDVCSLTEVKKDDFTNDISFILNKDGKVSALLVDLLDADVEDDAIYAVFNNRTKKSDADGDTIYRFTGLIDGNSFSYLTKDDDNEGTHGDYDALAGVFGVYAVILDANGNISKINDLDGTFDKDNESGKLASGKIAVDGLKSSNTVMTIAGKMYTADDSAVVYKFDDDKYTVSKLSAIDEGDTVALYDTKGSDADGIATVVIYIEK